MWTFPFGKESTPRPPRTTDGPARALVVGVYPSALHVRWSPPDWARERFGIGSVGAIAVDVEPTVFWDGADAVARVRAWKQDRQFVDGDDDGQWGQVRSAMNGTSGESIAQRVLTPLDIDPDETWFTDVVNEFFVKSANGGKRQQGEVIAQAYGPFAEAVGLPAANLPSRPSPKRLVQLATKDHRERLRNEIATCAPEQIITLGEEARLVVAEVVDECSGAPTASLLNRTAATPDYGGAGIVRLGNLTVQWRAIVHPGQRSAKWMAIHDQWIDGLN